MPLKILKAADAIAYALTFTIMAWMWTVHVGSVFAYPYFTPSSNVEELAYTYISSANYNRFGFLFSGFLQNFAASHDPADHPYVYNHMPPGPDIANALLMRTTGGSYAWTAAILSSAAVIGFVFYLTFIRQTLARHDTFGGGIFAAIGTPWMFYLPHFTNPIWNGFLLLTFLPLTLIGRPKAFFWIGLPVILISAVYLDYIVQASVIACWLLLYLLRIADISRKQIILVLSAFVLGLLLNLLKNFVYFGPSVFWEELIAVVSNRITGYPTQADMAAFYSRHGIVHHGARPPSLNSLGAVIWLNLRHPLLPAFMFTATAATLLTLSFHGKAFRPTPATFADFGFVARITAFCAGVIITPIAVFPAFAQEVNLYGGTNFVWLGLLLIALGALPLTRLVQEIRPQGAAPLRIALSASLAVLVAAETRAAFAAMPRAADVRARYANNPHTDLEILRRFADAPFMTNINVPTPYFYTRQRGFGVCGLNSVGEGGDIDLRDCKSAFMRGKERYYGTRPAYFFYFKLPGYFPGFADCAPWGTNIAAVQEARGGQICFTRQNERLATLYPILADSMLLTVYDLRQRR